MGRYEETRRLHQGTWHQTVHQHHENYEKEVGIKQKLFLFMN